jgi:hypothetical protein
MREHLRVRKAFVIFATAANVVMIGKRPLNARLYGQPTAYLPEGPLIGKDAPNTKHYHNRRLIFFHAQLGSGSHRKEALAW